MRKLKLDVSALRVESFEASEGRGPQPGTVRGNDATPACSGEESCGESCDFTVCMETCLCADTSPRPSCDACSWNGGC
ncbi:MAG TPA: hypothetical protein VLK84_02985 [Longimicrobium sp.]|nr:hypothetical protein [Longimicrobium sp.]